MVLLCVSQTLDLIIRHAVRCDTDCSARPRTRYTVWFHEAFLVPPIHPSIARETYSIGGNRQGTGRHRLALADEYSRAARTHIFLALPPFAQCCRFVGRYGPRAKPDEMCVRRAFQGEDRLRFGERVLAHFLDLAAAHCMRDANTIRDRGDVFVAAPRKLGGWAMDFVIEKREQQ